MQEHDTHPLVSVIIIFYNSEKYIAEAIDSVLAQSYTRWELLLVDDGSSDNSTAIAKHYTEKFSDRILYLEHGNHANLGKSTSRNLGIINSSGKYITFLDSDDVFLPDKLQNQLRLFDMFPEASMVFGTTQYWYSWDRSSGTEDKIPELGLIPRHVYKPPEAALFFLKNSRFTPCICSLLIRKQTLVELNGFEETIQDLFEDQVLIYKICLSSYAVAENSYYERYRQHKESTSAAAIRNKIYHPVKPSKSRLQFLQWLAGYTTKIRINDILINRILQKELRVFRYPQFYSYYLPVKNIFAKLRRRVLLRNNA